jgi:hypothetical protein
VSDEFEPGDALLFMKIGQHANEDLEKIIERKKLEIERAGFAMWGYGGNTCHPRTMVQPFAESVVATGRVIRLCMQKMDSHHLADQIRASLSSVDDENWNEIPEAINVMGSRYALCIKDLREASAYLPLEGTRVAIGNSKGRQGSAYLKGHVDKACLELVDTTETESPIEIHLMAELVAPYAVYLK